MRKDDAEKRTFFRSGERTFCLNGEWFFQTRESDHGPFRTRRDAERELSRYVDEQQFFERTSRGRPQPLPKWTELTLEDLDKPASR